jgi:predicted nucleic acid-binding Zn finger protein
MMSSNKVNQLHPSSVVGSVKLHRFQPSGTVIWTMVGNDEEHWVDLGLDFCSCKGYYYKTLSDGQKCYHLTYVKLAIETQKFTTIEFHDSERKIVINGLISDLKNSLLHSR